MTEIRIIYKKDIPKLLSDQSIWTNSFLAVSKHRLYAHFKNPSTDEKDIVLLLAYINNELVGYMGVFTENILIDGKIDKIGWLSTWWVHPKTKGSGIGREILNTMYNANNGKIGISQFTPSAKRVYDKSGYFNELKQNIGIKAVVRSNTANLVPQLYPKMKFFKPFFNAADVLVNTLLSVKFFFCKRKIYVSLKNVSLEYLNIVDDESAMLISKYEGNPLAQKTPEFFNWLKAYNWVQEAPLLSLTNKEKYEFSIYDKSFEVYLVKVIENGIAIGFIVLQKRNTMLKVLFTYYDRSRHSELISAIIKLHAMEQNVVDVVSYEPEICAKLQQSGVFLYKRKKVKNSIISKVFAKTDYSDIRMNYGDGDCSFA